MGQNHPRLRVSELGYICLFHVPLGEWVEKRIRSSWNGLCTFSPDAGPGGNTGDLQRQYLSSPESLLHLLNTGAQTISFFDFCSAPDHDDWLWKPNSKWYRQGRGRKGSKVCFLNPSILKNRHYIWKQLWGHDSGNFPRPYCVLIIF